MPENIKEHRAAYSLASYSTKQIITWTVAISGMILLFILIGMAFQRFLRHEFIGEKTKLIHICKKDPSARPAECAELLAARAGSAPRKVLALPGSMKKPTFGLSSDKDADLRPPPDPIR
jgi:hypothetical protein